MPEPRDTPPAGAGSGPRQAARVSLPIGAFFAIVFAALATLLVAFAGVGTWFSSRIERIGYVVDLAGSQRYGLYQIAVLLRRSVDEPPDSRPLLVGEAQARQNRYLEVFATVRDGNPARGLSDVSGETVDAAVDRAAEVWRRDFEPAFIGMFTASPEQRRQMLLAVESRVDAYVTGYLNPIVAALAEQQENTRQAYAVARGVLIGLGGLVLLASVLYLRRRVLSPINALIHDTDSIARGDFGIRSQVDSGNELAVLAARFNRMGEAIGSAVANLEQTVEERTRAQRLSHARLQSFIDGAPDAIVSMRAEDRTIILFSCGAERMFGYGAEEVLGHNVNVLMPEPYRGGHDGYVDNYLKTGERKVIGRIRPVKGRRKDGSVFDIDLAVSEAWTESGRVFNAIIRDISARVAAEQAVAEKSLELEVAARIDRIGARVMLALNQPDGGAKWADDVVHVLADEAGYRPLAFYVNDEWEGALVMSAGLGVAPGYDARRFRLGEGLVGEAAARREPIFLDSAARSPFQLDSGVGTTAAATLFALPIVYRDVLLGVISGASHERLTERERGWLVQVASQVAVGLHALRQFQELKELSAQLNERSRRIEAQNRELAQASRLKSEFLASMSHELRTPLNAIIGFSEVLKDGLLGTLTPEQLDYTGEIYQSGRHLLSLINDILDLSKIEAGKMDLDLETVEIAPLVENALTILKERAAHGGVSLSRAIADDVGTLEADGRKLRQIVYNLLSNAVKFTPQGGSVRVEVVRRGKEVEFAVSDTGIGISPEDQLRLFRAFEQIDSGIDRKFEGTGLGLVMVKSLVELHGGTLGVESEVGRGSRFWVRLPASRAARQPVAEGSRNGTDADGGPRQPCALVIDDDPAALALARRWLSKEGFCVELAADCDSAWRKLERKSFDCILLDIMFAQGASGWEFLEKVKQSPAFAGIPVIVISIVAEIEKGVALGAEFVLRKPLAGADLLGAVESLGLLPARPGEAPHVLVVDDDPRSVEQVARRLEQAGIAVTRCYGGADALTAVAGGGFSAVILDFVMPEVSGLDVIRALRADPATERLPVIVLTAGTPDPAECEALQKSVATVLSKGDWDEKRFLKVVRSAVLSRGQASEQVPSAVQSPQPPRILVIDDERQARNQLQLYLESAGYSVLSVEGAEAALRALADWRPDLVTLDLRMPDLDGLSFLERHACSDRLRGVPVLVVSGADHPQDAVAVGAHAVLPKPIRRHELLDAVKGLLRGSGGARVLVVDDDPRAVKIIASYFRDDAFEIEEAYGGQEALDAVKRRRPSLIVLDLMMPDVSGFDVLARLRTDPATRDVPVIVLTAKQLTQADHAALAASVRSVLVKGPREGQRLLDEVRRLIGQGEAAGNRDDA